LLKKIDHIGVAVKSVENSLHIFKDILGMKCSGEEVVKEQIHHIAFEVDNLDSILKNLQLEGVQLIDKEPRYGAGGARIAFLHPKSTNGILVELCEHNFEKNKAK